VAEITGMLNLAAWPAGMRVIVRKERPHPAPSCGSPTVTASPASPPTARAASSPISNCATAAAHAVRTASGRQRHRPAQPSLPQLHPKPDPVRAGSNGVRAAGLDPDARPARPGPALGTQTAAAAPVQRRRAHRLHRQAPAAAHRNTLTMGQPHHRSDPPASGPHPRLTSPNHPSGPGRKTSGLWNPARPE